jgi:hypothetical protein
MSPPVVYTKLVINIFILVLIIDSPIVGFLSPIFDSQAVFLSKWLDIYIPIV